MKKPFSVVMLSRDRKQHESLGRILERSCRVFHWALSVDEVVSFAKQHSISVLLLAEKSLQDSQVGYFQLIKSYPEIEQQVASTMLVCAKAESRQAYQLCRKKIFSDYFVGAPLYDPYHILLRFKFIKSLQDGAVPMDRIQANTLADVCECLDRISDAGNQVSGLNTDLLQRLTGTLNSAIAVLTEKLQQIEELESSGSQRIREVMTDFSNELVSEPVRQEVRRTTDRVDSIMSDLGEEAAAQRVSIGRAHPELGGRFKQVVLVEDNQDALNALETILINQNCDTTAYSRGTHFIRDLAEMKADVVMLDLSLPDISALHLIQRIKDSPQLQRCRIFAMAQTGEKDEIEVALQMGVDEVLMKPIDDQMLKFRINQY
ncbi:response regulator [Marinobacterium aestuariivivens]|uniref:PleD family two-component system response regulator n=1 Tax=Marinobacterium aestuariivivens TaxID=1698799 RepID=A0ABW2A2X3_9GAMM